MKKRIATFVAVLAILTGTVSTGVALAANPSADLDQCANDPQPSSPTNGCTGAAGETGWVNGNLGASKSIYREGDSIPYRMRFSNLVTGSTVHRLVIEWDTTKAGTHALDYLTDYNASVADANPCVGVSGCVKSSGTTFAIPKDPQVDPGTPSGTGAVGGQPAGSFTIWGGSITALSTYSYANGTGFAGDKSASIQVTFTASVANPVIAWGGHIATRQAWGPTKSAVSIPGSPYHTRLLSLDGAGGNQDRSLSADAVIFPGSITIIKDAVPNDAQDFAFGATGGLSPASFALDDDSDPTLSNTRTYANIMSFGTYGVTETPVANWTLGFNATPCTVTSPNGGSQSVVTNGLSINLKEGENVTCTFINTHSSNSPTVTTQVKTTGTDGNIGGGDDQNVANSGHVGIGAEVYDTSSLSGATSGAGGTIHYYVERGDSACTIAGATDLGTKAVTNGTTLPSNETTLTSAGTYYFWAVYSGDANNDGSTSGCSTELVVVDQSQTSTSTQVKLASNDTNVNDGGSVAIGTLIYDTNSVTGSSPTGAVTYYFRKQTTADVAPNCTSGTQIGAVKSVGVKSDNTSFSTAGTYELWAVYSGDADNSGSTSTCGTETVVVDKNSPTVNTQVKTTGTDGDVGGSDDEDVANGGSVGIGTEAYDTSSLTGGTATAGGTVHYYVEKGDPACTISGATDLGSKAVTNGTGAASDQYTFTTAGTYYFWAVYGGDANNNGNTSGCSTELVVVDRTQSSTSTQVKKTIGDGNVSDDGHIAIGESIYDTNDVTGSSPTGAVTYYVQKQLSSDLTPNCTDGTQLGTVKSVGVASDSTSFSNAGTYELWAVYSGDDNNLGSTSLCGSETVIVDKNAPDISTTPSLQVRDAVTISGLASVATYGNLTVKLVDGSDCNGTTLFTQVWYGHDKPSGGNAFTGNATYTTDWVTVSSDATLRWCSAYEGDANNAARAFADDNEVIAVDFFPLAQAAAFGFVFALPILLFGAWRRRRGDTED